MSGGSINYLYRRVEDELVSLAADVETAMETLDSMPRSANVSYAWAEVRELRAALQRAMDAAVVVADYDGPLHVAEWYRSGDYGDECAERALGEWMDREAAAETPPTSAVEEDCG